ncbi:MAG: hypothetical protein E7774_00060 [Bradyrhizobium sp.]|nr:MAG: hypothetical protein E7774_00060 [Bradyrhizobium sp.]
MPATEDRSTPADVEKALASVDTAKRETLRKLVLGAAFVIPVVASFSIDGLTSPANAINVCNMLHSGGTCPKT